MIARLLPTLPKLKCQFYESSLELYTRNNITKNLSSTLSCLSNISCCKFCFPNYCFPNIHTLIAIATFFKLPNEQIHAKSSYGPPQQPFLEVSPYFIHRISTDTKGPISPSSDGNSYVYVIVDAFTHYVLLHSSSTNALTVLFDHWINKFGIPDILVSDNGNE